MILSTILWINQVFDSVLFSLRSWRFVWREREKAEKTRVKRAFSSLSPLGFAAHLRARPTKPRHTCALDQQNRATHLRVRHTKPPVTQAGIGLPKDIRLIESSHLLKVI